MVLKVTQKADFAPRRDLGISGGVFDCHTSGLILASLRVESRHADGFLQHKGRPPQRKILVLMSKSDALGTGTTTQAQG